MTDTQNEEKSTKTSTLIQGIQKELEQLRKDRDLLLQIADKTQLARYYTANQAKMPKTVKLRSMDLTDADGNVIEKVIVGWQTLTNRVFKPTPNSWMEDQKIKLVYDDGSSQEIDYLRYVQSYKLTITATVLSRSVSEETGETTLKLRRSDNGNELSIQDTFVN